MSKPNTALTWFIHPPALGSQCAPKVPVKINGTPIPKPSINKAKEPRLASPVVAIKAKAPAKGAVKQGETIKVDKAPIKATLTSVPPLGCCKDCRRSSNQAGRRSSQA